MLIEQKAIFCHKTITRNVMWSFSLALHGTFENVTLHMCKFTYESGESLEGE